MLNAQVVSEVTNPYCEVLAAVPTATMPNEVLAARHNPESDEGLTSSSLALPRF
jgi:hypothetical protein